MRRSRTQGCGWPFRITLSTYALAIAWFFAGAAAGRPQLAAGIAVFWHPGVLLALQGLWLTIFVYTGRSAVTGATLSFHVHHERI